MKLKSKNYYIYVFSCKGSVNFISNSKRGKKETTYMHSCVCAQREGEEGGEKDLFQM